jgi:hypothetical protein
LGVHNITSFLVPIKRSHILECKNCEKLNWLAFFAKGKNNQIVGVDMGLQFEHLSCGLCNMVCLSLVEDQ